MTDKNTEEKLVLATKILSEKLDGRVLTNLNSCVSCGLCAKSCHYYLSEEKPSYIPGKKAGYISAIYRRYHTLSGKLFPALTGAVKLNEKALEKLTDLVFGSCSMCGRCTAHCSIGIDIPLITRTARSMLSEAGIVPKGLKSTADSALRTGNNMGITEEEFIDTLEWLEDDLQMEVEDENAKIPLNKEGVNLVYTLNPREPKFFPLSISAIAKVFYAAKEDWTISTKTYDLTNYSYFQGDDKGAKELAERHYNEIEKLNVRNFVLGECGHGFRAYRWEGPRWMKKSYSVNTVSVIEIMADYIKEDRIKLDPSLNKEIVTLHDPCNLVRNGGIIEEQRYILNRAVENFVEMTPNRVDNYCCGGGGGQLSMGEYSERRVKAGKMKAEQIRRTGAKIVATPCHNCIDQLMELNIEYKLDVEIKTIGELVADAITGISKA